MDDQKLIKQLVAHEGKRNVPYKCSAGKITIGVGRNLEDVGISDEEISLLLINDIERVKKQLDRNLPWWTNLDDVRQRVVVDMVFNMGIQGFLKFKKTIDHIEHGEFEQASKEMLNSLWAKQVKSRATRLSEMMRTGRDL